MTLKLITLNIEGSRHLARFLPFLKKEKPDVICLQEVFKKDVASIKKALRMKVKFIPMSTLTKKNKYNKQLHGQTGIAYITNLEKKE